MKSLIKLDKDEVICRACMDPNSNYSYLFEESLLKLFIKFTNLLPTKEDQLPQIICRNCKKLLEDFDTFQAKCKKSDLAYREKLIKKELTVNHINETGTNETTEISKVHNQFYNEEIKNEANGTKEEKHESLKKIMSTDKNQVIKRKGCQSLINLKVNSYIDDSVGSEAPKKFKQKKDKRAYLDKYRGHYICPVPACNKTFKFEFSLNRHTAVHDPNYDPKSEPRPYICEHCGISYRKEGQLNSHVRNKHGPLQEHPCKQCGQILPNSTRLKRHIEKVHLPEKIYSCDICNKPVGRSRNAIRSHMIFLHLRADHPCTTCDKSFRRPFELRKHIEWVHLGETRFVCQICNAKFSRKQLLEYHSFHHSDGTKKFKCTHCDWSARTNTELKRHIEFFHLGIKRHTCRYCDKSFLDPKVKKHHEMTHTGERPEICHICNKGFIQKIALKKHLQTHEKN